jgi:flagellar FliL protein
MATATTKQSRTTPKAPPQPDTDTEAAAPPAKNKGSRVKLFVLLALLLAGAGGGSWYYLQDQEQGPKAAVKPGAAKAAAAKPASTKPPVFVTLDQFTVNLQQEDIASQYLQVGLSLKISDAGMGDAIKLHMPEIRNRVLLLLSSKRASEIITAEGKKTLSSDLAREIAQPLGSSAQGLESVLFTSFVIQ